MIVLFIYYQKSFIKETEIGVKLSVISSSFLATCAAVFILCINQLSEPIVNSIFGMKLCRILMMLKFQ